MWEKGQSGNPAGRPKKGEALTDVLREKVDKQAVADKLISIAMDNGDLAALKYIYDRIDGRPVETVNQNVTEAPKVIQIEHSDYTTDPEDIEAMEE